MQLEAMQVYKVITEEFNVNIASDYYEVEENDEELPKEEIIQQQVRQFKI